MITMANSSSINKKLYIYKYDNFYVSVEQDDATNQQHVYFTLRALEILKNRYRKAFVSLFLDTQAFPTNQPKFENFSNSNKAFWIAFNNTPLYIAKSYTSFLNDTQKLGRLWFDKLFTHIRPVSNWVLTGLCSSIESCPGYSRDHRPDLNQVILNLVVEQS